MNTDKLTNTRYLAHGNVVTIDGKKYLFEQQSPDENHCRYCAFNGYRCLLQKSSCEKYKVFSFVYETGHLLIF